MTLDIQIRSFIFSFVFGCIFYFLLYILNRFTCDKKIWVRIIFSMIFIFIVSLLYFIGLLYINNGYVHIYFLISILVGYIFVNLIFNRWFTHKKKIK